MPLDFFTLLGTEIPVQKLIQNSIYFLGSIGCSWKVPAHVKYPKLDKTIAGLLSFLFIANKNGYFHEELRFLKNRNIKRFNFSL